MWHCTRLAEAAAAAYSRHIAPIIQADADLLRHLAHCTLPAGIELAKPARVSLLKAALLAMQDLMQSRAAAAEEYRAKLAATHTPQAAALRRARAWIRRQTQAAPCMDEIPGSYPAL